MVRNFQRVIGIEAKEQYETIEKSLPSALVACVGGGSNSIGLFHPFLQTDVDIYGVEGGGKNMELGNHSATLSAGSPGILHGSMSYVIQDSEGQISSADSIAPGLDYPGVGPEHSFLKDSGRVNYSFVDDSEAIEAFKILSREEGIIPAIESSHAIAKVIKIAADYRPKEGIIVCLSGRGDKDFSQNRFSNGSSNGE